MESETISINLVCTSTITLIGLLYTLILLSMHDFVVLCIIYLENIDSHQAHSDFPNVDLFHYKIQNITFSIITTRLIRKKNLLSIEKL